MSNTIQVSSSSNANFPASTLSVWRLWGASVSQMFTDMGLVRNTADSGQITSWLGASVPGSPLSVYEIWSLPDGLSPTVVFKVWYGYVTVNPNYAGLQIIAGTGTDGTGGITGPGSTVTMKVRQTTDNSTLVATNYGASDGSGFVMALGFVAAAGVGQSIFAFDRHRNPATGAPLLTGASAYYSDSGTYTQGTHIDYVGGTVRQLNASYPPCVTPGGLSAIASAKNTIGQTEVYPWWSVTPNSRGQSKMIATYNEADLPTGVLDNNAVSFLGATRTYKSLAGKISGTYSASAETGSAPMIWWSD